MKKKRLTALLIALVLFIGLTACGEDGAKEAAGGTTQATQSALVSAPSEQAKEVTVPTQLAAASSAALAPTTADTPAGAPQSVKAKASSAAAAKPAGGKTKWEISTAGITAPLGAKLLRAWVAEQNGVKVEAYRLEYGAAHATSGSSGSAKVVTVQPTVTIAIVHAAPEHFYSATAKQATGKNVTTVGELANAVKPLIGVNVAYWYDNANPRFVVDCPVVVGGKLVQNGPTDWPSLNIYKDGTWEFDRISPATVNGMLARGLTFNIVDQHVPIQNGRVTYRWGSDYPLSNGGDNEPYGFYGQIDKNTYIIAAGEFMNRNDMVDLLVAYGTQTAVELNGGNSLLLHLEGVGNAPNPNSTGKSLQGLNKLNITDNEHQYLLGIFGGQGKGGTNATIDFIYFK
ncbi:MAG: hypothetical protein LBC83_05600 [Oscillospiraceae bacterium]|jgi:hypothetical protein|nr:hypothetical protein [Oscillospiraceae bacterium]